jgi:hypothetical protein
VNAFYHLEGITSQSQQVDKDIFDNASREIFKSIVLVAEDLGLIDTEHLLGGYEPAELVKVFNEFCCRSQYAIRAEHVMVALARTGQSDANEAARKLNGVIVAYSDDLDHYFVKLADGQIVDSWPTTLATSKTKLDLKSSLVIFPLQTGATHAQTH